jgi:Flp pilus assembly protein TadB
MSDITTRDWLSAILSLEITALFMFTVSAIQQIRKRTAALRTKRLISIQSDSDTARNIAPRSSQTPVLEKLSRFLLNTPYGKKYESKCLRAGIWQFDEIVKWSGRKFEVAMVGALLAIFSFQIIGSSIYLMPFFIILGFFLPDLVLTRKGAERSQEIVRNLPETIDLLNMTVEAGLGFQAGLERISRMKSNPLSDEFRRVLSEIRLGDSRTRAFASMAERINQKEIWSFTNAITQVEKLGIPITSALRNQATQLRSERRDKAKEIAQKLPVKILAPIMLLLLPSVLIIVLGPAIFTILQSL